MAYTVDNINEIIDKLFENLEKTCSILKDFQEKASNFHADHAGVFTIDEESEYKKMLEKVQYLEAQKKGFIRRINAMKEKRKTL